MEIDDFDFLDSTRIRSPLKEHTVVTTCSIVKVRNAFPMWRCNKW